MSNYYLPTFSADQFHCAFCNVYSSHIWTENIRKNADYSFIYLDFMVEGGRKNKESKDVMVSRCLHCQKDSIWYAEKLIYPNLSNFVSPNPDMPDDIKKDFEEARSIFDKSPRGSAALLRLCIQKLMIFLGEKGKNINDDIACLVEKGLSPKIQRALDYCRVVGNNAVHPAELNIDDTPEIAELLFKMINFIVEEMISKPKEIEAVYALLPQKTREAIEKRDSKTNGEKHDSN